MTPPAVGAAFTVLSGVGFLLVASLAVDGLWSLFDRLG